MFAREGVVTERLLGVVADEVGVRAELQFPEFGFRRTGAGAWAAIAFRQG